MPVTRRKAASTAREGQEAAESVPVQREHESIPGSSAAAAAAPSPVSPTPERSTVSSQSIVAAGACVNALLIGVKFAASLHSGSSALLAEANHSLFDLAADAGTSSNTTYTSLWQTFGAILICSFSFMRRSIPQV
jgi:hypothetical protein